MRKIVFALSVVLTVMTACEDNSNHSIFRLDISC